MNELWRYNNTDELMYGVKRQLNRRFTFHPPDDVKKQVPRYEFIRQAAYELGEHILHMTPTSIEQSHAMERLDEVVMWANAAIARNE